MKQSLFYSSFKSFFAVLFGTLGFGIALLMIAALFTSLFEIAGEQLETTSYYTPKIAANGKGVRKEMKKSVPVLLKINIEGVIGSDLLNQNSVRQQLIESREGSLKNDRVKGVLLHINTPGGTAIDSDTIYRTVMEYKKNYKVPVYAYVDGACLSGGMYVTAAADQILTSEVSIIGSIGTISGPYFNVSQLLDKWGVESKTLTAGQHKDDLNPFRPWKPDEAKEIEDVMRQFYDHFVKIVATSRPKVDPQELKKEYGAKIFPAEEALKIGLVDKTGLSLNEAVAELADAIEAEDEQYQVVEMQGSIWYSGFLRGDHSLLHGTIKHKLDTGLDKNILMMNKNWQS